MRGHEVVVADRHERRDRPVVRLAERGVAVANEVNDAHVPSYSEWNRFWIFWKMGDGVLQGVRVDPEWEPKDASVSIVNEFMRAHPNAPSAYPQINYLTAPLRAAAAACAARLPGPNRNGMAPGGATRSRFVPSRARSGTSTTSAVTAVPAAPVSATLAAR